MTRTPNRERERGRTTREYPQLSTTPVCELAVHDANRTISRLLRVTRICTPVRRTP